MEVKKKKAKGEKSVAERDGEIRRKVTLKCRGRLSVCCAFESGERSGGGGRERISNAWSLVLVCMKGTLS